MTNSIDSSYFFELAEKNPEDVCRLAFCDYDPIKKGYRISVWGEDYGIYPHESKIIRLKDDNSDVSHLLGLFIIYYILRSKDINISKEWISEKDIPGGATFFVDHTKYQPISSKSDMKTILKNSKKNANDSMEFHLTWQMQPMLSK